MAAADPYRSVARAKTIVCAALALAMLLAPKLWLSSRSYPLTPILPGMPALPPPIDWLVYAGALVSLAAACLLGRPRPALVAAVAFAALLAVGDQSRWQPWFYMYGVMIALFARCSWRRDDDASLVLTQTACRIVVVGVYLWSGLHKLNVRFLTTDWEWMSAPLRGLLPPALGPVVLETGFLVPLVEVAIAVGLAFARTRRAAVVAACGTHLFVLLSIGPFGLDWNPIVWPWNVAMMALVFELFWDGSGEPSFAAALRRVDAGAAAALALFVVLPALSLVDRWDTYLSAGLYSGDVKQARMVFTEDAKGRLPPSIRAYLDERDELWPMDWSFAELGVPAYPEDRVFRSVARAVCAQVRTGVTLAIASKPDPISGERSIREYRCNDL